MFSKIYLTDLQAKQIAYNLALGLVYIHKSNLIHRDIKPANILINLTDYTDVKMIDFGLSRSIGGNILCN